MKKTSKKVQSAEVYEAKIKVFGKDYKATGSTVKETLESLKVPGKVAGTCLLTITHGSHEVTKILGGIQASRLFSMSKLMREIALKNISLLFNGI